MNKHVILTGANGYLGSYIAMELLRQGYFVIAGRYQHYAPVIVEHDRIQYVDIDIKDSGDKQPALEAAIKGKNVIGLINAAALLGSSDYENNFQVNAIGVLSMMDFCRYNGIKRFIQISSVVVLKAIKGPYGETKLSGQQYIEASELDYTVFIPAMIMGPESLGLNRVLKNVFRLPFVVPLIGSGRETQHPIYVKDFARAIVQSLETPATFKKTYQIAGDTVIPFRDFIKQILKYYRKKRIFLPIPVAVAFMLGRFFQKTQKVPIFTAEHVKGILQDSNLDVSGLKKDINFKPTPFEQAMSESLTVIGKNWDLYLKPRNEKIITADEI